MVKTRAMEARDARVAAAAAAAPAAGADTGAKGSTQAAGIDAVSSTNDVPKRENDEEKGNPTKRLTGRKTGDDGTLLSKKAPSLSLSSQGIMKEEQDDNMTFMKQDHASNAGGSWQPSEGARGPDSPLHTFYLGDFLDPEEVAKDNARQFESGRNPSVPPSSAGPSSNTALTGYTSRDTQSTR